jgi:16S rRNA (cytidine1402-2'-O)-methyltransferase
MSQPERLASALYIVATPIGNLGDITYRAVETLRGCDLIACEDTRMTARLLQHYGVKTDCVSYHEHNAGVMRPKLLEKLQEGARLALVSDAGTPLISDPGYKLVREAQGQGFQVIPLPGPSATLAALSACGLPTDRFLFAGFLPSKAGERANAIDELAQARATLVLFESARRLSETLSALAERMGGREAAVARELTKLYEEIKRGTLTELAAFYRIQEARGEIVLVIAPPLEEEPTDEATLDHLLQEALKGHSLRDAAEMVATATGLKRKLVYARALMAHGTEK